MATRKTIQLDMKEVMSKARKLGESYSSASFVLAPDTLTYLNKMLDKQQELNRVCSGEENGELLLEFPFGVDRKKGAVKITRGKVEIKRSLKIRGKKEKEIYEWVNVIVGMPHFREKIKRAREAETWENLKRFSSDDKLFFTEMIEGAQSKDRKAAKKKIKMALEGLGYDVDKDSLGVLVDGEN